MNSAAIDEDGNVFGVYSNGQSQIIGQLALAVFDSNDGLAHAGSNMFNETPASGQANIGAANSGNRGSIAGGYLEQSNVNITNEFVELIEAQRGFQANSRVITTASANTRYAAASASVIRDVRMRDIRSAPPSAHHAPNTNSNCHANGLKNHVPLG